MSVPRRTRIMVGGVRALEHALIAVDLGVDAIAFDFDRDSPDRVDPGEAFDILGALPPFVASVGVFTNPDVDEFSDIEQTCPVSSCVLAGGESEKLVRQCGPNVIKGLRYDPLIFASDAERWTQIEEVDALLVTLPDSSGETMRRLADAADVIALPVIVAGVGEAPEIERVTKIVRPFGIELRQPQSVTAATREWLTSAIRAVRSADA